MALNKVFQPLRYATPGQGIILKISQMLGVTGNLWREDNKGMSPPRELPVETQAGGMKQMRGRPQDKKLKPGRFVPIGAITSPLLPGCAQHAAEWLRQS